jgi:hypothetical protein
LVKTGWKHIKNTQKLSDKELLKNLKSKKIILGFYTIIIIILVACAVIIATNKVATVFIFMPSVFTFFFFCSWRNYNKIEKGIKKRNIK